MATAWMSEPAENELRGFATNRQQAVADAISLLEDDSYRKQNKLDLNLVEKGYRLYSLLVGTVWLGFHEDTSDSVCVDWISLRSRFRP
jgi:hypothetical protein